MDHSYSPKQPLDGKGSTGPTNPLEAFSSYQGLDWTPQRLVFHQNLESFADKVLLLVALQGSGKINQEQAFYRIRGLWKELKRSKHDLLD